MISSTRRVGFLCVPHYLLRRGLSFDRTVPPTPGGGRHPADRVWVHSMRLLPGTPLSEQSSTAPGSATTDLYGHSLPAVALPSHLARYAPFRSLPRAHWRGAFIAFLQICRTVIPVMEHVDPGAVYLDLSGLELRHGLPVRNLVQSLVERAWSELQLPVLGGIGRSKVLAYLAARRARLAEVFEPTIDEEQSLLDTEPVGALPGLNRWAIALLHDYGVVTVGQLARLRERDALRLLGAGARDIFTWVRGADTWPGTTPLQANDNLSAGVTFPCDTLDYAIIIEAAQRLADRLVFLLRQQYRLARVVWVRVTYSDRRQARSVSPLSRPTSLYPEIHRAVLNALHSALARRVRVRRLEVGLSRFTLQCPQERLFLSQRDRLARLCSSLDVIWAKYGRVVFFADAPQLRQKWT